MRGRRGVIAKFDTSLLLVYSIVNEYESLRVPSQPTIHFTIGTHKRPSFYTSKQSYDHKKYQVDVI